MVWAGPIARSAMLSPGLLTLLIRRDRTKASVGLNLKVKVKWHHQLQGMEFDSLFLSKVRRHLYLVFNKTSLWVKHLQPCPKVRLSQATSSRKTVAKYTTGHQLNLLQIYNKCFLKYKCVSYWLQTLKLKEVFVVYLKFKFNWVPSTFIF